MNSTAFLTYVALLSCGEGAFRLRAFSPGEIAMLKVCASKLSLSLSWLERHSVFFCRASTTLLSSWLLGSENHIVLLSKNPTACVHQQLHKMILHLMVRRRCRTSQLARYLFGSKLEGKLDGTAIQVWMDAVVALFFL